jgi:hypothetical protein
VARHGGVGGGHRGAGTATAGEGHVSQSSPQPYDGIIGGV